MEGKASKVLFSSIAPQLNHSPGEYDILAQVTQHPLRPKPNRDIDQIFMLPGSQLTQAKLIAPYLAGKEVIFVGDGDSMALSLGVLGKRGVIPPDRIPAKMTVLDFDSRIVEFVRTASQQFGFHDIVNAEIYNVRDPLPEELRNRFDVVYVNPPYGSKNQGFSGIAFLARGLEATKEFGSRAIAILPYNSHLGWTYDAMRSIQSFMFEGGCVVSEMLTAMHLYHLDDSPDLKSGTTVFDRVAAGKNDFDGRALTEEEMELFYGSSGPKMPDHLDGEGSPVYK